MEKKLEKIHERTNLLQLLQYRELNPQASKQIQRYCQFTYDLVRRLGFEYELQGHQGCVNCLQWSSDGRLLASGSDDTQVMIWEPMSHRRVQVLPTNHIGNIFSVKFLGNNNSIIATAAGDCRVIVQTINGTQLLDCKCHKNRVKRLASSPMDPTMFWSASEDGRVMQYDLREPHDCASYIANVFVSYQSLCEMKCIAINPTKPHYLAVGSNDAFVRLYDRRMLKPCALDKTLDIGLIYPGQHELKVPGCVQYYAPGHLAAENVYSNNNRYVVTYIAFNAAGSEMLVNMGGEQIYLFDVNKGTPVNEIFVPSVSANRRNHSVYQCRCTLENSNSYTPESYDLRKPRRFPKDLCPCFYMRRGFHLYRRRWVGDLYCAAKDYLYVIQNWPNEIKAYINLIKCLLALEWEHDATRWYSYLCDIEPNFEDQKEAENIRRSIQELQHKPLDSPPANTDRSLIQGDETKRRHESIDYKLRFVGHCNTTTDIMEANFLGEDGNFVCAGSDEGVIFMWERKTQTIVNALVGDVSIVNCLQPHPTSCLIASSGIDPVVRLWSPMPEDGIENTRAVKEVGTVVRANQHRMAMDPFETLLINMGYQMQGTSLNADRPFEEMPHCRTS